MTDALWEDAQLAAADLQEYRAGYRLTQLDAETISGWASLIIAQAAELERLRVERDAQLRDEAKRLPQWQAVVKCLDREKSLIWIIENTVQVLIRNLALEMLGQQRAALKAWRDGQRPPTEYEQKLVAMKKDFPNGI